MVGGVLRDVEAGLEVEDRLAVLDADDAAGGEAAAVTDAVDLVQDGDRRITRPEGVSMERMRGAMVILNRPRRRHERLAGDLTTENALTVLVRRAAAKE